jgi:hypothetical protein
MILGSKVRRVRKADNLTAIYQPIIRVPGYRSKGSGSIPSATTFSEK